MAATIASNRVVSGWTVPGDDDAVGGQPTGVATGGREHHRLGCDPFDGSPHMHGDREPVQAIHVLRLAFVAHFGGNVLAPLED
jgi:hypothetical protein